MTAPAENTSDRSPSRADQPPRKVLVATTLAAFDGDFHQRVRLAGQLGLQAEEEARVRFPGRTIDLLVFPETAFQTGIMGSRLGSALTLDDLTSHVGALAACWRCHLVAPAFLREEETDRVFNAAVLYDRQGGVAGIYRKAFPVGGKPEGPLEDGVTPGADFPVFDCDFGKMGIQICWDMSYPDGWDALASRGVELVVLPSASPQTVRPMAHALRGAYYVINSTPRDNVTVISPIGTVMSQRTKPGVHLQEIDLSFAIVHWAPHLDDGRLFERTYGDRAGYHYVSREDTGIFWSNDRSLSVAAMLNELKLHEMRSYIDWSRHLRNHLLKEGRQ